MLLLGVTKYTITCLIINIILDFHQDNFVHPMMCLLMCFLFYIFRDQSYIANLPHSTIKHMLEHATEMGYAGDTIKRKVDLKRERHRGKNYRSVDGECKGKADVKKRHRGRHCRCRRRRLECRRASKVLSRRHVVIACPTNI